MLLTLDTRAMLVRPQRLVSRGELPLKGKSEPVELFAQVPAEVVPARGPGEAAPGQLG